MVIAFYPYFFLIPGTNAFRGLCCSLIVMVQLAQFLQQVEQEETFERMHEREYEEQALRRACLGSHPQLPRSDEVPPEITIDLTQLRPLEEYR